MRYMGRKGKMTGVWKKIGEKMVERYVKVDRNDLCLIRFIFKI